MKPFVAKVSRMELANSKFGIANRMAGNLDGYPYRFITEDQVRQMERYRITVYKLNDLDKQKIKEIKKMREERKQAKRDIPTKKFNQRVVRVTFKDEDGYFSTTFNDESEANKWRANNEAKASQGEKFEIVEWIVSERVY